MPIGSLIYEYFPMVVLFYTFSDSVCSAGYNSILEISQAISVVLLNFLVFCKDSLIHGIGKGFLWRMHLFTSLKSVRKQGLPVFFIWQNQGADQGLSWVWRSFSNTTWTVHKQFASVLAIFSYNFGMLCNLPACVFVPSFSSMFAGSTFNAPKPPPNKVRNFLSVSFHFRLVSFAISITLTMTLMSTLE